jgi:hypothetical protein
MASSSGRLARSVAMITHSLVKKFWRNSGISVPLSMSSTKLKFPIGRDSLWETPDTKPMFVSSFDIQGNLPEAAAPETVL